MMGQMQHLWRRRLAMLLGVALFALLPAGCGYERQPTYHVETWGASPSPNPQRYGEIQLLWVEEYYQPTGILRFPDGGRAFETDRYALVLQSNGVSLQSLRYAGMIRLEPVRRGDFGNLLDVRLDWAGENRLKYAVRYGYSGNLEKVAKGEIELEAFTR